MDNFNSRIKYIALNRGCIQSVKNATKANRILFVRVAEPLPGKMRFSQPTSRSQSPLFREASARIASLSSPR